jgi:MarR family transcriptional regulator for hemolysin
MIDKAQASEVLDLFVALKRARGWTDKKTCDSLNIGPTKARLLGCIDEHDGISQTELARATDTDKSLAGRLIQEFIVIGWVRRERSSADGRAYVLSLSPSGRKLVKQLGTIRDQVLDRVIHTLNGRDVADFRRIVSWLLDTMKEPLVP